MSNLIGSVVLTEKRLASAGAPPSGARPVTHTLTTFTHQKETSDVAKVRHGGRNRHTLGLPSS